MTKDGVGGKVEELGSKVLCEHANTRLFKFKTSNNNHQSKQIIPQTGDIQV